MAFPKTFLSPGRPTSRVPPLRWGIVGPGWIAEIRGGAQR